MRAKFYFGLFPLILLLIGIYQGIFASNSALSLSDFLLPYSDFLLETEQNEVDTLSDARISNQSNVEIPIREGFPFCETFIGFDLRNNIQLGGNNAAQVELTGNSLQLTGVNNDESGYMFVDIPFSSLFGLKVSFEFSNYGGDGADGVSFFMFDGSISASEFEIGGTGGALGYTAVRATSNESSLISPGLKGAYIGIGFDELGNFGNSRTGKFGGFDDPNNDDLLTGTNLFPHSVVVRGPVDGPPIFPPGTPFKDWDRINDSKNISGTVTDPRYESYKFIDGRIFDPTSTGDYGLGTNAVSIPQYLHPDRFEIDTDSFADGCPDEGFRKVFLDLNPIDVTDRSKGYTVEIQMLVNVGGVIKLVNVFDGPINYPFGAPELLKVGFAAATGLQTNYHEIRNVTVQVSNENALEKPNVEPLNEEVCEGEINEFELEVELTNDADNAFIRCLQLYYSEQEALDVLAASGTSIPFPIAPIADPTTYCPTGNCVDLLCRPERTTRPAYDNITGELAGQFEVFLVEEGGEEVPKVRFIPEPGYSGETTMYYTVTDNFGQVSDPKPITIIINPQPDPVITTLDPLVWEQQEVNDIRVLLESSVTDPSYSYQWFRDGNPIPGAEATTYLATQVGDYSVEVTTPLGCVGLSDEEVTIRLTENLQPDFQDSPFPETCADLGSIRVVLNNLAVTGIKSDGTPGNEKWRILDAAGAVVIDWTFLAPGQSEIIQGGLVAGNYIFQLGDEFREGQPGSDGQPLFRHVVPFEILPIQNPLQISSVSVSPELCFGEGGQITVVASGGEGPSSYTFTLVNGAGQVFTPTSVSGSQAQFDGVPQGNYEVTVASASRCSVSQPKIITGPSSGLEIDLIEAEGISCGIIDSGFIIWQVSGGTPPYTVTRLTRDGNPISSPQFTQNAGEFTFANLKVGQYILNVTDANDCPVQSDPVSLTELPAPVFSVTNLGICEGGNVTLTPTIVELSNSVPTFNWLDPSGATIIDGTTVNGISYNFQDDGDPNTPELLIVSGLSPGDYDYKLQVSGENICNQPVLTLTVSVSPKPVPADPILENLTCFESADGVIEVQLDTNLDPNDFSYELLGYTGLQDSPRFESLAAGNYQVSVVNKSSLCETIISDLELTQPDPLEFQDIQTTDPSCGENNGTLSFRLIGGTPDYAVQINNEDISTFDFSENAGTYTVTNLAPGDYDVEVLDQNSCPVSLPLISLVNDPLDPITVEPLLDEVCQGDPAQLLPTVDTPGTFTITWFKDEDATTPINTSTNTDEDGLTYLVNTASGELQINGLLEGNYDFYFKIDGPGLCPSMVYLAEVSVFQPLKAVLEIQNEGCFEAADGQISVEAEGANGIYEFSLNGGPFQSSTVFSNLNPGNYTIDVRSGNGCNFSISGEVEGATSPISISSSDFIRASCDLPNGSIENLVISGGWGEYTVKWTKDSPTGAPVNGDLNGTYDLFSGTYFLTVADKNGCIEVFRFDLEAASDPVYTLVPAQDVCEGDRVEIRPIHLQPSPGLPPAAFTEVRWYKGPNQTGLIQNGADPNQAGVVYTIDDADWLNPRLYVDGLPAGIHKFYFYVVCTGVELETEVEVFPVPKVEFETLSESCLNAADGRIRVKSGANPNFRYGINGAAQITQAQLESTLFAPGIYSIVVTQQGVGCPSDPIQVEILRTAAALSFGSIITRDPGCGVANGRIEGTILGGWAPYQVILKTGSTIVSTINNSNGNFAFTGLNPGNFSIEVTDSRACVITSNLVVLVPGPTRVDVDDLEICEGEVADIVPSLDPPAAGATINWYFDAAKTQPITSSASPAPDGKVYQIDPNGVLSITGLVHTDGIKIYYADVTGTGICPGFTASPKVRIKRLPVLSVQVDRVSCFGEKGKITLSASAGNGNFQFSLDGTNFQNSGIFEVNPGIYTAYVRSEGCLVSTGNIEVLAPPAALTVSNTQLTNPTCNDQDGQITFSFSGGYGPDYNLSLLKDGVVFRDQIVNGNNVTFTNLPAGVFTLSVSDGFCTLVSPPVTLVPVATPIASNDDVVCEGGVIQLNPTTTQAGVTPQWTWYNDKEGTQPISNGQTEGAVTYTIGADGKLSISGLPGKTSPYLYYLGISGNNICPPALLEVKATVYPIPNLRVSNPSIVCDPTETVDLTKFIEGFNPAVFDYQIISPSGTALRLDEINKVSQSGDYRVSSAFKGLNCWNLTERIRVIISDTELIPDFDYQADLGGGIFVPGSDAQILEDILFDDQSQGKIVIWSWDFGDGNLSNEQNPIHQYQVKGTYTVKLTTIDEFGCVAETQKVIIAKDDYVIIIPNAFTPDGAKNQYFKPQYRGIVGMEFYVFSTWGELVFQSNSLETQGWDGFLNGKPAIPGNYVYRAVFITRSGEKIEKSGTFILIR